MGSSLERFGSIVPRATRSSRVVESTISSTQPGFDMDSGELDPMDDSVEQLAPSPAPIPINRKRARVTTLTEMPPQPVNCTICKDAGYTRKDVPYGHPQFNKLDPCVCKKAELKTKRQQALVAMSGILGSLRVCRCHLRPI